jgi:beta-N-acetylhexosaminidase
MQHKQDKVGYRLLLSSQLQQAQKQKVPSVLIAKGSPYLLHPYSELTDTILVTFDDHIYQKIDEKTKVEQMYSSGYTASVAIVFGQQKALGELPVSLQ